MVTLVLFVFALFHFFYDPYNAESIAESTDSVELLPGDPDVRLAVLTDVKPGTEYRIAAKVDWKSVEAGEKPWKTARIVFFSFNKQGRWIPAPHEVCCVTGSGKDSFETVLSIPEGAASTRLIFQHRGKTGSVRLKRFSLQQMDFKKSAPWVFRGLQTVWFLIAGWTIWHLRLLRRWSGMAVVLVAGMIAAGMLIPGEVVHEAPDRMADLVRPVETPDLVASSAPAKDKDKGHKAAAESWAGEVVQNGRKLLAEEVSKWDFHILGHAGLFLLLGVVCAVFFRIPFKDWSGVLVVFAGGGVYAIAVELLQVTELTRTVRFSDVGVNVLGWLAGLIAIFLLRVIAQKFKSGRAASRSAL